MFKHILQLPLLLLSISINAQIEQYFIPSKEYTGKVFDYKTKPIKNGKYYFTSSIEYRRIHLDTVDVVCSQIMYENKSPNSMGDTYKTYIVDNKSVRHVYTYSTFFDKQAFKNSVILKYPPSTWVDKKADPDVDYLYKSEFGKLTTQYGQYDCIIVTLNYKALDSSVKDIEKDMHIYYYARGLGLVKEEFFVEGDLVDYTITGTLVDNFSKNSFEVMNDNR
ncbi:MAG: hypothetical protein JXR36_09505 [Bacteroidales bacterium]|nr:hypothetical protein [Bacteroidales bacterium]